MPRHLQKSLQDYLAKIKRETGKIHLSSNSFSSSKKWVLAGCRHPKTLSFSMTRKPKKHSTRIKSRDGHHHHHDDDTDRGSGHAATLSDIDRFLEENFKSLCIRDEEDDDDDKQDPNPKMKSKMKKKKKFEESSEEEEEEDESDDERSCDYESDTFRRAWGPAMYDSPKPSDSQEMDLRKSGQLTDETRRSMGTTTTSTSVSSSSTSSMFQNGERSALPENCIAVLKYTPEPQEDFRRSMVEMVEARMGVEGEGEEDWDFMEELLFCYLDLNDKKSHRYILSAFVDLIVVMRENDMNISARASLLRSISTRLAKDRLRSRTRPPF